MQVMKVISLCRKYGGVPIFLNFMLRYTTEMTMLYCNLFIGTQPQAAVERDYLYEIVTITLVLTYNIGLCCEPVKSTVTYLIIVVQLGYQFSYFADPNCLTSFSQQIVQTQIRLLIWSSLNRVTQFAST